MLGLKPIFKNFLFHGLKPVGIHVIIVFQDNISLLWSSFFSALLFSYKYAASPRLRKSSGGAKYS